MANQPIINGKVVERSYEDYRNSLYLVNRRYQRKLVWGVSEKRAFIDSLANGYPVPLFLFSISEYKDIVRNEIIDGMQRLNAIFSFIENEYSLENGFYFDLSATAITKDLLDRGILIQKHPVLDRSQCVKIVSYELPYSIYNESDPDVIDEVFRRINSNGQHLSRQEIRQAGATSEFAQLVRLLSTQIRGDVSHDDVLLLSKMEEVSINQELNDTGINADTVFWVKENIINKEDLRQSMDEEQVADLLAAMVLNPIPPSNVSVLDEYYGFRNVDSETRGKKIEDAVLAVNPERLSEQFLYVLDEIKKIFYNRHKTIIGHIVGPRIYKGPRYFQILFLSLYELLVKQEKKIIDYDRLYNQFDNISSRTMNIAGGGGWWTSKEKTDLVAATVGVIASNFVDRADGDPMYHSYTTEVETLLKQSHTENSQYDFKQGIYNLATGERNDDLLKKIFKTITAMANSGKKSVGYVIVGVADKVEDAEKICERYNTSYIKVGSFYITGVDGEVSEFNKGNYDEYFGIFKNSINSMPISEHYKRQLGSKMRMVNYHDKSVIIIKIICDNGAAFFDNGYFTRSGASNDPIPVSPESMPAFFAKF
ncbi:DUF262 domain-containing protein [Paenibacillus lautus]|uniref:GmrSD restriction endonuclease domain-containing protein n=1 Tax=Paenibacillus lautus TaxID=1401 RepID=UPI002DB6931F|nr:DUF262 domain-containing protein [Paenibacillus lautus]MEC0305733.1 DUF262 domain-containing protein [Paenibacillus lautus]